MGGIGLHTVEGTDELEVFYRCELFVNDGIFRNISEAFFEFQVVGTQVVSENGDFTFKLADESALYFYRRGFAGSVATEVTYDFSGRYVKVDAFKYFVFAKTFFQVLDFNTVVCHFIRFYPDFF